jgi:hypothetical protein
LVASKLDPTNIPTFAPPPPHSDTQKGEGKTTVVTPLVILLHGSATRRGRLFNGETSNSWMVYDGKSHENIWVWINTYEYHF